MQYRLWCQREILGDYATRELAKQAAAEHSPTPLTWEDHYRVGQHASSDSFRGGYHIRKVEA